MNNNRLGMALLILLGLFFSTSSLLQAQADEPTIYVDIHYMKSKNGDYLAMEKEIAKPVYQECIQQGKMIYWGLYAVEYPGGVSADYDYVTINVYRGTEQFAERNNLMDIGQSVHAGKDMDKIMQRILDSRDGVKDEVFVDIAHAWDPPADAPRPKFVVCHKSQVEPGGGGAYVQKSTAIFQPFFKARAEAGNMQNWHFLRRRFPIGADYSYQYISFDLFHSMEQLLSPAPKGIWEKAHGEKSMSDLLEGKTLNDLRTRISTELWRVVDEARRE